MHYFFFRKLQLITVFHLIRSFYTNWNTWLIFLKLCVGFSIFVFVSFLLNFIFLFTKSMDSLTLKLHNSFQNKNNRKARHSFAARPLIFKFSTRRFKSQWYLHELELPKNWPGNELFELRKSEFWVHHFFWTVTFK